jgi:oligopeptide transport system substrate-binding protein
VRLDKMRMAGLGVIAAGALVLAGCSAGGDSGGGAAGSGIITTNGNEPQNPLIPTNTTEVGGGKIIDSIFAGLVSYDAEGAIEMEVAESIEPNEDNTLWTVTLADGWTFTNDEPVTAQSFVDAWNYGAYGPNAQGASYFFDNIAGYADVQGETDDEGNIVSEPAAETMSGLTVVSDTEFTVALTAAEADFPLRLGYSAYVPLPEAAFEDMEAFGENPIGNGPYMLDGEGAWEHDVDIDLVTNPDYEGVRQPANDGLNIRFYAQADGAYNDLLADELDIIDLIPSSAFETYEDELEGRSVNQAAAIFQSVTIPQYLDHFGPDEEGQLRRQAISMAIDRQSIIDAIFAGTRTPARDFTSPVIDGYSEDLEGSDVLDYDAEGAAELWAQADAIRPYEGTFTIAYNTDGDHEAWVTAATNSISNALGITAEGQPYATFAELLEDEDNDAMTGAFRSGWQADYPSMFNFLAPLYQTGAGSNYGRYSSPEFDQLLVDGQQAASVEDATGIYQSAQEVLLQDMPVVPLWYSNVNGGWSNNVDNVEFGWNSVPLYYEVTKG